MFARRPLLGTTLLLGALLTGGCGAKAGSDVQSADFKDPTEKAVEIAITDFTDAAGKRDYERICADLLAAPLVKELDDAKGTPECPDQLERSLRDIDEPDLAVRSIRVQGADAVAVVRPTGTGDVEKDARLSLAREGSRWKVSGLG